MRAFSLILGVFCLAGCTGPDIVPLQGDVPAAVYSGGVGTGAITRLPADSPVSISPSDASAASLENPQARYDDAVRRGRMKEASRLGLGVMTGSQSCGGPATVVAPAGPLSKPCGVAPLDDFSLDDQPR